MNTMDTDSEDVNTILEMGDVCLSAPRFGKNGKELLLTAVQSIDSDFEFQKQPSLKPKRSISQTEHESIQPCIPTFAAPLSSHSFYEILEGLELLYRSRTL